jgi:hypothetical protein
LFDSGRPLSCHRFPASFLYKEASFRQERDIKELGFSLVAMAPKKTSQPSASSVASGWEFPSHAETGPLPSVLSGLRRQETRFEMDDEEESSPVSSPVIPSRATAEASTTKPKSKAKRTKRATKKTTQELEYEALEERINSVVEDRMNDITPADANSPSVEPQQEDEEEYRQELLSKREAAKKAAREASTLVAPLKTSVTKKTSPKKRSRDDKETTPEDETDESYDNHLAKKSRGAIRKDLDKKYPTIIKKTTFRQIARRHINDLVLQHGGDVNKTRVSQVDQCMMQQYIERLRMNNLNRLAFLISSTHNKPNNPSTNGKKTKLNTRFTMSHKAYRIALATLVNEGDLRNLTNEEMREMINPLPETKEEREKRAAERAAERAVKRAVKKDLVKDKQ